MTNVDDEMPLIAPLDSDFNYVLKRSINVQIIVKKNSWM